MKKIFIFALAQALAAAAFPQDFAELDAKLSQALAVRVKTAEAARSWSAERGRLEALEKSYGATLAARAKKLASVEAANEKFSADCDVVLKKVAKDEDALERLSAFLDMKYSQMISNAKAAKIIGDSSATPRDFFSLTVVEKFRAVRAMIASLAAADSRIERSEGGISTGIFVSGSGAFGGDVSRILVSKEGER